MSLFGHRPIGIVKPPLSMVETAAPGANVHLGLAADIYGKNGVTLVKSDLLFGPERNKLAPETLATTTYGTAVLTAQIDAGQGVGQSTILGQNTGLQFFIRDGSDLVAGGVASSVNMGPYNPSGFDVMAITWSDINGEFQAALNGVVFAPSTYSAGAFNLTLGLMVRPNATAPTAGVLSSLTFYDRISTYHQLVAATS